MISSHFFIKGILGDIDSTYSYYFDCKIPEQVSLSVEGVPITSDNEGINYICSNGMCQGCSLDSQCSVYDHYDSGTLLEYYCTSSGHCCPKGKVWNEQYHDCRASNRCSDDTNGWVFCTKNGKAGCKQGQNILSKGIYESWGDCITTRAALSNCMRKTITETGTPYQFVCLEDTSDCDGYTNAVCGKDTFSSISLF